MKQLKLSKYLLEVQLEWEEKEKEDFLGINLIYKA